MRTVKLETCTIFPAVIFPVKYTLKDPRTSPLGIYIEFGKSRYRLEPDDRYIVIATNTTR